MFLSPTVCLVFWTFHILDMSSFGLTDIYLHLKEISEEEPVLLALYRLFRAVPGVQDM